VEDAIYPERSITLINNVAPSCFKAVDEMFARIYEPVLWRSFNVANANVRIQAAQLLTEACPVQNPEACGVPHVREVGVHCVCRVLSLKMF
jgi:hypothetical protein